MIQLVELVTVDNEDLAYHYGSDNINEVFEHERFFNELKIFHYRLARIFLLQKMLHLILYVKKIHILSSFLHITT